MTNKISIITFALASLFFYSCSTEEDFTPESQLEADVAGLVLIPKTLATIQLSDNIEITFKTEEDGIVFEAVGDVNTFSGLGKLESQSMLSRFLALTNNEVPVPEDLISLEENQKLKSKALQRGVVQKHNTKISSKLLLTDTKGANTNNCSGTPGYYDTDGFGRFTRTFKNYLAGNGTIVYGSWKNNKGKCKTVQLWLSNCSTSTTLKAKTYYKNVFGKYKHLKTIKISPDTNKFWGKTYLIQRYRKTAVVGSTQAWHRFGGYLSFLDYK